MEGFTPIVKQPQKETFIVKGYNKKDPLSLEQKLLVESGYEKCLAIAKSMFYRKNKNQSFQLDDFISWGAEGLIEAAKKFDISLGFQFNTYAETLIRGRILDNLRVQSFLSRDHIEFLKKKEEIIKLEGQRLLREPTEEEIAIRMGLTLEEYFKILKKFPINAGIISSSDTPNEDGSRRANSFLDSLLYENNPHYNGFSNKEKEKAEIELLAKFLEQSNLDKRERKIIHAYFFEELTEEEIAEELHLTRSRVNQIKNLALGKLRRLFKRNGYKVFNKSN